MKREKSIISLVLMGTMLFCIGIASANYKPIIRPIKPIKPIAVFPQPIRKPVVPPPVIKGPILITCTVGEGCTERPATR